MKKNWKTLAIIVMLVIVIVMIIFIVDIIYSKTAKVEPNDLFFTKETTSESIKATKGGYSWKERGILREINVIADSLGPTSFDYSKNMEVNVGDKLYFDDHNWTSVNASIILQKDRIEIAKVPIESNLEESYIVVPDMTDGEYIIQINLKSDNGEVWYSAKINISK